MTLFATHPIRARRGIAGWLDQRIPVIPCDEWTPQQVKAFRLMVNGSVTWDEALLFQLSLWSYRNLNESDFDLILTGFDPGEIDRLLAIPDEERATAAPLLQMITLQREQSKISRTILSSDRTGFPCLVRHPALIRTQAGMQVPSDPTRGRLSQADAHLSEFQP